MTLCAIAYVSQALPAVRVERRLDDIVEDAARFNRVAGVTGVLLHDGARFLQYIEGPPDGMDLVYERILQSRSHAEVLELGRGAVPQRHFPYWAMRWLATDGERLQELAAGDWHDFCHDALPMRSQPCGLELLGRVVQPMLGGS